VELREKHRLRAFEKMMLRKIFISKRDEVMGGRENGIVRNFIAIFAKHN
jgi:hypothetical protein